MSDDLKLILTVFTYGQDQKRAEIELRPTIPVSARGQPAKIDAWIQALALTIGPDFKHTNEWGCEICGRPARESKYNVASWSHLAQPRTVFYIHNLCEAGLNMCHLIIKQQEHEISGITGSPMHSPIPGLDLLPAREVYPLASSCAQCHDENTAKKGFRMSRCGGVQAYAILLPWMSESRLAETQKGLQNRGKRQMGSLADERLWDIEALSRWRVDHLAVARGTFDE